MTPTTVFRVASISKSVTAWGVLRLAEQGKINLDSPAEAYLPTWPLPPARFPSREVTVRRLLNHTSGLNEGTDTFRRPDQPAKSPQELLLPQATSEDPHPIKAALTKPAGQKFVYSVPGYALLQLLVRTQAHQPFSDYMETSVLQPIGMTSSSFKWTEDLGNRIATPYMSSGRPGEVMLPHDLAADGLLSTAEDMSLFMAAALPNPAADARPDMLSQRSISQLYADPADLPELPALGYFIERNPGQPDLVTNGGFDPAGPPDSIWSRQPATDWLS
jgi:CubicO group peptidase (beta-lactamase class C family)